MKRLLTAKGKPFQYKGSLSEEIIVYPSDRSGNPQDKSALVITPFVIRLIKSGIQQHGRVLVGARRDHPPQNSLGAVLKAEKLSPQQLSYLVPILQECGFCSSSWEGGAVVVHALEQLAE